MSNISDALSIVKSPFIYHVSPVDWGHAIFIMEKHGHAFGHLYLYDDDDTVVYLSCLSVDEEFRNKGLGTKLQEMREEMGVLLGASVSCLLVRDGTWMHDWYKRRGYVDFKADEDEDNSTWMRKVLKSKDYINEKITD